MLYIAFLRRGNMSNEVQVRRGRGGRPPGGSENNVEERLLTAATRLFLERGYDGTSCDQVALDARAGKASIYSRYANKAALFAAVINHLLARPRLDVIAANQPLNERLAAVGMQVVEDALHPDSLALLRLLVAELPRIGDIGVQADQMFWQAGVERIASVIALGGSGADTDAVAPARHFVDMVLAPILMRVLLGEAVAPLLDRAPKRIAAAIILLNLDNELDDWK